MSDEKKMSFLEHLEELRKRLIRCVVAVFVGMIVCWFFREQILAFLLDPLYEAWSQVDGLPEPQPLNFTGLLEPFVAYLKLAALGGVFFAVPVILHQLWKFIAPGLYPKERRLVVPFVFTSSVLFIGGSVMAYSVVFPIGFRFFLDFAAGTEMSVLEARVMVTTAAAPPEDELPPTPQPLERAPANPADAGPIDAGIDVGPAADAGTIVDAGTADAGPPVATPPAAEPPPQEPPAEQVEKTWYEWLLGKIFKEDCGTLEAAPAAGGGGARLVFGWHVSRCGEPPEISGLTRDEKDIEVAWSEGAPGRAGTLDLVALDTVAAGEHVYSLSVPRDPSAHKLAPVLMVKDFLSFAIRLLLAFGLIFELPILITFLSIAGIVNYKQLLRFSRWFLVISVVIGAMLTPPDVITQLLLALPLMVLYFLSIGVAFLFGPKPDKD